MNFPTHLMFLALIRKLQICIKMNESDSVEFIEHIKDFSRLDALLNWKGAKRVFIFKLCVMWSMLGKVSSSYKINDEIWK